MWKGSDERLCSLVGSTDKKLLLREPNSCCLRLENGSAVIGMHIPTETARNGTLREEMFIGTRRGERMRLNIYGSLRGHERERSHHVHHLARRVSRCNTAASTHADTRLHPPGPECIARRQTQPSAAQRSEPKGSRDTQQRAVPEFPNL